MVTREAHSAYRAGSFRGGVNKYYSKLKKKIIENEL